MKPLIPATTSAVTRQVTIPADQYISLVAPGLQGAEQVTVAIRLDTVSEPVVFEGSTVAVTSATNMIQIAGPATYDIIKPSTTSAVAVWIGV